MLAAVSVDLDEIPCYAAIYGLSAPTDDAARAIYRHALGRFERLFRDESIDATFFAIGSDLDRKNDENGENGQKLRALREAGHEIANHTFSHRYDLTRLGRPAIREEVIRGIDAVERAVGERPTGFRAPGYTITDDVFDVLRECEVGYDSSVFPCPAYYGLKALAISAIRARGRRSHSVVDHPRVLAASPNPYRVSTERYTRPGSGVLELPVAVTRGARLPYIGTTVVLAGALGARVLTRSMHGRPLINLELHGIDLADRDADGLSFLAPHQQDLRVSAEDKERALRAAFAELRKMGYRFVTLQEAAEHFG